MLQQKISRMQSLNLEWEILYELIVKYLTEKNFDAKCESIS